MLGTRHALPDSGVIERDIQTAKSLHGLLHEFIHFGGFRDISANEQTFAAGFTDQFDGLLALQFASAGNYYFRSRRGKKHGGLSANSRRPAGHQPNFAFQIPLP